MPLFNTNVLKRRFVSSIFVSYLATYISGVIISLLLIEIAGTFKISVGIASQLRTINAVAELIFALLMSLLMLRFAKKSIFMVGLVIIGASVLGSYFAPDFNIMMFWSFIEGAGSMMVIVSALTLIGDSLPQARKSSAVGIVTAATYISGLIGTIMITLIAPYGWRFAYLSFGIPIFLAGLIAVLVSIPKDKVVKRDSASIAKITALSTYRGLFTSKSAVFCLFAGLLLVTQNSNGVFLIAFRRLFAGFTLEQIAIIMIIGVPIGIIGSMMGSRLSNRYGAKPTAMVGFISSAVLFALQFSIPSFWIHIAFSLTVIFLNSLAVSSYHILALEQVPQFRGHMMSFTRFSIGISNIVVPAIGGVALVMYPGLFGYQALGVIFFGMLAMGCVLLMLTKNVAKTMVAVPTQTPQKAS